MGDTRIVSINEIEKLIKYAQSSWLWILQGQQSKRMEMQTASGFCKEIQKKAQRTDL